MSIMDAECPVCKKNQAHAIIGVQKDDDGKEYQTMVCSVCKTSNRVYTGEQGKDFQANYDYPDNTNLSDIE